MIYFILVNFVIMTLAFIGLVFSLRRQAREHEALWEAAELTAIAAIIKGRK